MLDAQPGQQKPDVVMYIRKKAVASRRTPLFFPNGGGAGLHLGLLRLRLATLQVFEVRVLCGQLEDGARPCLHQRLRHALVLQRLLRQLVQKHHHLPHHTTSDHLTTTATAPAQPSSRRGRTAAARRVRIDTGRRRAHNCTKAGDGYSSSSSSRGVRVAA